MDVLNNLLKLFASLGSILGSITKKDKAPVAIVPQSSTLAIQSKDFVIFCVCLALVFSSLALLAMAMRRGA